jgi:hypothetical protein
LWGAFNNEENEEVVEASKQINNVEVGIGRKTPLMVNLDLPPAES